MAPVWSKSDDDVLHEAVSSFGQQWSKVARQDGLAGRSVKSVRHRWLRISMQERSIALPPTPLSNGLPRLQASAAQWRPYHRDTRDRTGGRPWEYFVSCSMTRTRVPSDRQWSLIKNWCLDNPTERLLLCNLGRAEGIMRRRLRKSKPSNLTVNEAVRQTQLTPTERDALHLAYHPGEVCHTMTSSNANLYWVCGSGCKQGFLLRQELASFMGMDCFANLPALHLHKIPDSIASSWIAESVHRRMATHCAEVSLSMIPQKSHYDIGSLYSGGFDALAMGFSAAGARVRRIFAAELNKRKAAVLRTNFGYWHIFRTAASAATQCPRVDILVASPSCHEVSKAKDISDQPAAPASAVATHGRVIIAAVQRACPMAVVIEQSDGLRTHHPQIYRAFRDALDTLPYVWMHRNVDAHREYGGTHSRERLLWIGIRRDLE